MALCEAELKRHLDSIKKSWAGWSKDKKNKAESALEVNERYTYGSHYDKLAVKTTTPALR